MHHCRRRVSEETLSFVQSTSFVCNIKEQIARNCNNCLSMFENITGTLNYIFSKNFLRVSILHGYAHVPSSIRRKNSPKENSTLGLADQKRQPKHAIYWKPRLCNKI